MQVLSRPENQEKVFKSNKETKIFRPFIGVFLFFVGKLFNLAHALTMYEKITPGFMTKPVTLYNIFSVMVLSPIGLHIFLAYHEFFFYRCCTFQRTFANFTKEYSGLKLTKTAPTLLGGEVDQKNHKTSDNAPKEMLHCELEELIDLMKNMTEVFGPLLLQNLFLMLIYWLLHVYSLCYFAIEAYQAINIFISNPLLMVTKCFQLTGLVLIVKCVKFFCLSTW